MKITAIILLKTNSNSPDEDPIILADASDVTHFGYFQRSSIRQFILFISRTVAKRTRPGVRCSLQHEGFDFF